MKRFEISLAERDRNKAVSHYKDAKRHLGELIKLAQEYKIILNFKISDDFTQEKKINSAKDFLDSLGRNRVASALRHKFFLSNLRDLFRYVKSLPQYEFIKGQTPSIFLEFFDDVTIQDLEHRILMAIKKFTPGFNSWSEDILEYMKSVFSLMEELLERDFMFWISKEKDKNEGLVNIKDWKPEKEPIQNILNILTFPDFAISEINFFGSSKPLYQFYGVVETLNLYGTYIE
jgi:hypothetical protein